MPERAQITSVEALEAFRASLLTYLDSARPTLDEIGSEVMRTRSWLEDDRLRYWEREVQRRYRLFREAEDALFSARLSQLGPATDAQVQAVRKTKTALEEATERLRRVKKWCREFDSRIAPLARQLDSLRDLFSVEMPRAAVSLERTLELLADYSGNPGLSFSREPGLPEPGLPGDASAVGGPP